MLEVSWPHRPSCKPMVWLCSQICMCDGPSPARLPPSPKKRPAFGLCAFPGPLQTAVLEYRKLTF